ncbi:MAG: hypothetical protein PHN56_04510 [Candidatus Nanoarchaeia archaeon]|nr:hypothetical protein [Candidatus Nanoarchaeia archaeon]
MIKSTFDLTFISSNHGSSVIPDISLFPECEMYCPELPNTEKISSSVFNLLNDRSSDYFKTENLFINYCNKFFKENTGKPVYEHILSHIYNMVSKCNYIQAIGCLNIQSHKSPLIKDYESSFETESKMLRFSRSVNITNNILYELDSYSKIVNFRRSEVEKKWKDLKSKSAFENELKNSTKLNFFTNRILEILDYSGLPEYNMKPKIINNIFSQLFPVSLSYVPDNSLCYINPHTLKHAFEMAKHNFYDRRIDSVVIEIGDTHELFVKYFVSQKYPIKNEINFSNNKSNLCKVRDLEEEIMFAEKNNLIKFDYGINSYKNK